MVLHIRQHGNIAEPNYLCKFAEDGTILDVILSCILPEAYPGDRLANTPDAMETVTTRHLKFPQSIIMNCKANKKERKLKRLQVGGLPLIDSIAEQITTFYSFFLLLPDLLK
jgi:hypothetical protein